MISQVFAADNAELCRSLQEKSDLIIVPDTLSGLQNLALWFMGRFQGLKTLGITGSSGKTTTKEIIGSILSRFTSVAVNEGNLNSEIGLSQSSV